MPGMLKFLRWVAIVIWATVLVLSATVFALAATDGLGPSEFIYAGIAILAVYELQDWLT